MATLPCSPRTTVWTPTENCRELNCTERNTAFLLEEEIIEHFHEGVLYSRKLANRVEVFAAVPNPAPQETDAFGTDDGGGTSSAKSYSIFHKEYVLPQPSAKASSVFGTVFLEFNRWALDLIKRNRK